MGMHLRRRPLVEPLESRALLSGLQPPVLPDLLKSTPPIVIPPILPPLRHVIALAGTVKGTYTERYLPPEPIVPLPVAPQGGGTTAPALPIVNFGKIDELTGTGTVKPLGAVTMNGDVFFPGPWPGPIPLSATAAALPARLPGGFLILSTTPTTTGTAASAGGSVFVALQEVSIPTASAGGPLVFRYFILGGTGAYRGASGTGTADLTLTTPPTPLASTIPSPVTGKFTLVFNPILPPAT